MSFLRNVVHDLVEKRLWPIAIALIVAVVAVPVVLGGGSESTASAGDATAATGAATAIPTPSGQVVSLDVAVPKGKVARAGSVRNPFKQQHVPKAANPGSTSTAASGIVTAVNNLVTGGSSPTSPSTGSAPSGGGGGIPTQGQTPTPAPKPAPKPDPKDLYRVTLRFGQVGDLKVRKDVARLTPMPNSSNPFLVFLGVKSDGKTAVFLVSSDVLPSGDGRCKPTIANCSTLQMKVGDTELLDVQSGAAGVVQYRLDLRSIDTVTASQARAARAHARVSTAGRDWLRLSVATDPALLSGWQYDKRLGVMVERPDDQAADVAHVPADVQAAVGQPAPAPAPAPAP